MSDDEWLLQELDRWRDPAHAPEGHAHIRAAVDSPAHQQLGSRLRRALRSATIRPVDWPLPPPC
jgi:hypothetical protein